VVILVNKIHPFLLSTSLKYALSAAAAAAGQPVKELCIDECTFESKESLRLLCHFFASNSSPKALQKVQFRFLRDEDAQVYECLLSSLHNNKTITELSLAFDYWNYSNTIPGGATGGKIVGDLLEQNTQLTALKLSNCHVNGELFVPCEMDCWPVVPG
jgi:hypothetical protein